MKNTKILMILLVVVALLLTAKVALADAPVIGTLTLDEITISSEGTLVEGVESTIVVGATGDDGETFEVDGSSEFNGETFDNLDWITVDGLTITLNTEDNFGTYEMIIVVSDSAESSEGKSVNLTIKPALEVTQVEIDGKVWDGEEEFPAAPGEEVTVKVTFVNNFDDEMGHVDVEADVSDIAETYTVEPGVCDALLNINCEDGDWALENGDVGTDEFIFKVPYDVSADTFDLSVKATYDDFMIADWFPWWVAGHYENEKIITFNVEKDLANIHLDEVSLLDTELTCAKVTDLTLSLINTGEEAVTPELLVYNKEGNSFDKVTGKFTSFNGGTPAISQFETLSEITDKNIEIVKLDLTELEDGTHTLYLYIVNPYFEGASEKFIAGSATIEVTTGACLNWEAIEEELRTAKSSNDQKEVDFFEKDDGEYVYIFEDKDYETSLTFQIAEDDEEEGIVGQSNLDVIECSMDNTNTNLGCDTPNKGQSGTSELTIEVVQDLGAGEENKFSEYVDVVVDNTLSISNVKINNDLIAESEVSEPLNPFDEIEVKLTVTNHLDHAVTGVVANLVTNGIDIESEEAINLEAKQSKEITFNDQLSYLLEKGEYDAELTVSGEDYEDNTELQSDVFEFTFNLEQEAADLVVSELIVDEELLAGDDWEGFTCDPTATVRMVLTNTGSNTEDDVVVTITGAGEEIVNELEDSIAPNTQLTKEIDVPTRDLNSGSNTVKFEISYRNGYDSHSKTVLILKNDCLKEGQSYDWFTEEWEVDETNDIWILEDKEEMEMRVVLNEEGYESVVDWYVLGEEDEEEELVSSGQDTYTFSETEPGNYDIIADVNGEEFSWFVIVTDKPFSNLLTTNIAEDATGEDLIEFKDFTVENTYGKIVFNGIVNLDDLFDLDDVITISDGLVAINTVAAPELNVPATITLNKNYDKHLIFVADSFDEEEMTFEVCPDPEVCDVISNDENGFTFKVTEFSTYKVMEDKEAELTISEIVIADKDRGDNVSVDVTITNVGSFDDLTDLTVELSGVNNDYKATVSPLTVKELKAGNSFTVKLEFTIPEDENAGEHNIGNLKVTGKNELKVVTQSTSIKINPKSHLSVDGFKVNGKTTGKLELGNDENVIKVQLKNDYSEDMEDVFVTVTILDVDGDDIDEESEEIDLDEGKSEWLEITFDLSDEELDDDSYTIEIIAEGVAADDDSEHETITTEDVDIDREDHKVVIKDLDLSASIVQCPSRHSTLEVTVENVGKKNEDVEVTVKNSALGLDETKDLDLDKFSGDDPKDEAKFYLDSFLADATAQSYPLTIEVSYDDGDETETDEVTIEVKDCVQQNTATQQQAQLADAVLAKQLQQQLQQQMNAKQTTPSSTSTVKTSFRGSSSYTLLLGVLVFLVLIAIMLAFAVAMKKK
ncbi:hypothetical protein HOL59_04550 [Candidatus Woesearchaeota archaeon]|jgi:hypothetical protein|nr:hypothetical protein [Candidatus Woesearchaeota archaeon]